MRRLAVLLCALSCIMGLILLKKPPPEAVQLVSPTMVAPTPTPDRICVEEVAVVTPSPTPQPQVTLRVCFGDEVKICDMEEYLVHVVAGEMPASYEEEALRAQAVAARTYIAWKMPACGGSGCSRGEDADICTDSTHCMAYWSEEEMRSDWGESYTLYREKIEAAVRSTAGQVLLYHDRPVQALFHASSHGSTEDAQAVWGTALPYLTPVSSGEEDTARIKRMTRAELASALNRAFEGAELTAENVHKQFVIRSATPGGRADSVRVGQVTATGREVRRALGLSSTAFEVRYDGDAVTITTQGYGHGVGMSQEGANAMAQQGKSWQEILTHYYTGVSIGRMEWIVKSE